MQSTHGCRTLQAAVSVGLAVFVVGVTSAAYADDGGSDSSSAQGGTPSADVASVAATPTFSATRSVEATPSAGVFRSEESPADITPTADASDWDLYWSSSTSTPASSPATSEIFPTAGSTSDWNLNFSYGNSSGSPDLDDLVRPLHAHRKPDGHGDRDGDRHLVALRNGDGDDYPKPHVQQRR